MTPNSITVGNSGLAAAWFLEECLRNDDRFSSFTSSATDPWKITDGPRMSMMLRNPPSEPTATNPTFEAATTLTGPCIISYSTYGSRPSFNDGSARELISESPPGLGSSGLVASLPWCLFTPHL